jgi:hypothetical protein
LWQSNDTLILLFTLDQLHYILLSKFNYWIYCIDIYFRTKNFILTTKAQDYSLSAVLKSRGRERPSA